RAVQSRFPARRESPTAALGLSLPPAWRIAKEARPPAAAAASRWLPARTLFHPGDDRKRRHSTGEVLAPRVPPHPNVTAPSARQADGARAKSFVFNHLSRGTRSYPRLSLPSDFATYRSLVRARLS